ncbi:MAG: sigma-70 family RNA polymerase sigma factor [Acidobacteriota bacterium]|jgi:RNA polymerase sigma-70 factor, ECF subfamily
MRAVHDSTDDLTEPESDFDLVRLAAEGDRSALAAIIERHQHLVLGIAYRYLQDRSLAEDVAQDVFLSLWKAASRYRPDKPLPAYLRTLTVNQCLDIRRKRRPEALVQEFEKARQPDSSALLVSRERRRLLAEGMAQLPPAQKMAVVLFHLQGLTVRETAQAMQSTTKAVESLLSRARASLRKLLSPYLQ